MALTLEMLCAVAEGKLGERAALNRASGKVAMDKPVARKRGRTSHTSAAVQQWRNERADWQSLCELENPSEEDICRRVYLTKKIADLWTAQPGMVRATDPDEHRAMFRGKVGYRVESERISRAVIQAHASIVAPRRPAYRDLTCAFDNHGRLSFVSYGRGEKMPSTIIRAPRIQAQILASLDNPAYFLANMGAAHVWERNRVLRTESNTELFVDRDSALREPIHHVFQPSITTGAGALCVQPRWCGLPITYPVLREQQRKLDGPMLRLVKLEKMAPQTFIAIAERR